MRRARGTIGAAMTNQSRAIILYGMPGSLYTAKVRAYLRKRRLPFVERAPAHPAFQEKIIPAIGRWIIPVIELPDGTIIQDGADILAHFEAVEPIATPASAVLEVLARIMELFGGEGLLRPAMHYRWNFDEENLAFLQNDFLSGLAPRADDAAGKAVFDMASGRMRKAGAAFGVTAHSIPAIERAYGEFLALLNAHVRAYPYVLGGQPTLADFGLVAPLYPHLGRDPAPARLMQRTAPFVWRWVERMNAPLGEAEGEYLEPQPELFSPEALPETLLALLRFVAEDYLPEMAAHVAFTNAWLEAQPGDITGTNGLARPHERALGMTSYAWRGQDIFIAIMPYRLYLLQRIQDAAAKAGPADQARIQEVLAMTGLSALLTLKTHRRVERANALEVWGPDLRAKAQ